MKILFRVLVLFAFLPIQVLKAQMVGPNAYIEGTLVHIGIAGCGGFEGCDTTVSPPPVNSHCRTNTQYFGFVANPQNNSWATFDGDFFTPGSPENGWGITMGPGTSSAGNNCEGSLGMGSQLAQIYGSITSYAHVMSCYLVDWSGTDTIGGTNLAVHLEYQLVQNDLYYTTTISIKNNTAATIPEMYYYRNLDPDNNIMLSGDYTTQNTVVSQPGSSPCEIALVSATQSTPWNSYVGFAAAGANWRATYGGFANRNGYDMWNCIGGSPAFVNTVGSTYFYDEAIQLSYKIINLAPGATETMQYVTILADSSAARAISNLAYFKYPGSTNTLPSVCQPTGIDTVGTCGGPVDIAIMGANVGNFIWTWTPSTGLSASTGDSVIASPSVTTSYTVTGTPTIPGCGTVSHYAIVVLVTPGTGTVTITPVAPLCLSSGAITLSASSAGGTWAGTGITSPSAGTFDPATAGIGSHIITYTLPGVPPCIIQDTTTITVYAQPTITSTGATICNGAQATITAAGAATYLWSNASTGANILVSPTTSTTYTVTGTDINGCSNTASCVVTVNPIPPVTVSASPSAICDGSSTTLTATGATTYSWSGGGTANPYTVTPASTITYTVTGTSLGCTASASTTITVNAIPTVTVTETDEHCNQSNGTATATPGGTCGTGFVYTWSCVPAQTTQTATGLPAGNYSVTVDCGGCETTGSTIITNLPGPSIAITSFTNTSCGLSNGGAITSVTGNNPPYHYNWSNGQSSANLINVIGGTYTVTLTDAVGCSATNTVTITASLGPSATSTSQNGVCGYPNGTATVNAVSGIPPYAYLWSPSNQTTQTAVGLPAGGYFVTVTDASGCTATSFVDVYNTPGPIAGFSAEPTILTTLNDDVHLLNNSSGNVVTWDWNFGDGTLGIGSNINHTYPAVGSYVITLIVIDNNGCSDTISDTIKVKDIFAFYVPNAFSPNNDEVNDVFYPKGNNVDKDSYNEYIFDRWGNLIFHTTKWTLVSGDKGEAESWNGTKNNSGSFTDVIMGTYVYRITLKEVGGVKHEYIGKITIVP